MKKETDLAERIWNFIDKYKIVLTINLIFLIVIGLVLMFWSRKQSGSEVIQKAQNVRVEIAGAINKPGVYILEKGTIVEDLIKKAGGLSDQTLDKDLFTKNINRVEILSDGQKITIPQVSSTSSTVAGASTSKQATETSTNISSKINLNSASLADLDKLPGIGPTYAQRIIDYRNSHNGFKTIEEIQNVKGIGPKTFEKLKDLISI